MKREKPDERELAARDPRYRKPPYEDLSSLVTERPRDGSKTRNDVPPLVDTEEPDGKEARRPRAAAAAVGWRGQSRTRERGGGGEIGGGPRRTQTDPTPPLLSPHSRHLAPHAGDGTRDARASRRGHTQDGESEPRRRSSTVSR